MPTPSLTTRLFKVRGDISLQSEGTLAQVGSALLSAIAEVLDVSEADLVVAAALASGSRMSDWSAEWHSVAEGAVAAESLFGSASDMSSNPSSLAESLEASFAKAGLAFDNASLSVGEPVMEAIEPTPSPTLSPPTPAPTAAPTAQPTVAPPTAWPTPAPTATPLSEDAAEVVSSLVAAVESQETEVLNSLFGNVSTVVVSNVGGVASVETAFETTSVGVTAATVVDAAEIESSGASAVEIIVEDTDESQVVKVVLPTAVIVQATDGNASDGNGTAVGIAVTILADAFPETEAASAQVSIVVTDENGNELSGVQLAEPVEITLLETQSEGLYNLTCAWWDSAAMTWSTSGVQEVVHDGPQFICQTDHLSIFTALASVVNTLEKALICSNSLVFTSEAFQQAASDTTWVYSLDGAVYGLLILVTIALLMLSHYSDSRWRRQYEWRDECFCTTNDSLKTKTNCCLTFYTRIKEAFEEQFGLSKMCRMVTYYALAYEQQMAAKSVKHLLEKRVDVNEDEARGPQGAEAAALRHAGARLDDAVDNVGEIANQAMTARGEVVDRRSGSNSIEQADLAKEALWPHKVDVAKEVPEALSLKAATVCDTFWLSSRPRQVWILFVSVNRFAQWKSYSIYDRSSTRVVRLVAQFWGAMAAIALFSEQTGSSLSHGSDEDCETGNFWEQVHMDVAVGFWSAIMSSIPLAIAHALLLRRRFMYKSDWGIEEKLRYARCWRLQELVLILLLGLYAATCVLFVGLFLASVTPTSRRHMTASSISSILTKVVLVPLGISVLLLSVATVYQRLHPGVLRKINEDIKASVIRSVRGGQAREPDENVARPEAPILPGTQRDRANPAEKARTGVGTAWVEATSSEEPLRHGWPSTPSNEAKEPMSPPAEECARLPMLVSDESCAVSGQPLVLPGAVPDSAAVVVTDCAEEEDFMGIIGAARSEETTDSVELLRDGSTLTLRCAAFVEDALRCPMTRSDSREGPLA